MKRPPYKTLWLCWCGERFNTLSQIILHKSFAHNLDRLGSHQVIYQCTRCQFHTGAEREILGHCASEHLKRKVSSKARKQGPEVKSTKMTPAERREWVRFLNWQRNSSTGAKKTEKQPDGKYRISD